MENVKFIASDVQKSAQENSMLWDKVIEKFGFGHCVEFSIENDVLSIRSTQKTFMAPIQDVTVEYVVSNRVLTYIFKAKSGAMIKISRNGTYLSDDDVDEMESIIQQLPGYKGRNKTDRFVYVFYILLAIVAVVMSVVLGMNDDKPAPSVDSPEVDEEVIEESQMSEDDVICAAIHDYLLDDPYNRENPILTHAAKAALDESTWPEAFCEEEGMLYSPSEGKVTVYPVGNGKYKYKWICPEDGTVYVDDWTITAIIDQHGDVRITNVIPDNMPDVDEL